MFNAKPYLWGSGGVVNNPITGQEGKNMIEVKLSEGKYKWVFDGSKLVCLRYGIPWRNETGDGAVLALIQRVDELEKQLQEK